MSDLSIHSIEADCASVDDVSAENQKAEAPVAKTLACARAGCSRHIWGDIEAHATRCCKVPYCQFCWNVILEACAKCEDASCPEKGCFLEPHRIYWYTDEGDLPSEERDLERQLLCDYNPEYQDLKGSIDILAARRRIQEQHIRDQNHKRAVLDDQIRQSADRIDATTKETEALQSMLHSTKNFTEEMTARNEELRERIRLTNEKKVNIENRLRIVRGEAPSSAIPS